MDQKMQFWCKNINIHVNIKTPGGHWDRDMLFTVWRPNYLIKSAKEIGEEIQRDKEYISDFIFATMAYYLWQYGFLLDIKHA